MSPKLDHIKRYHIFLASRGNVNAERQYVRIIFDHYIRSTARRWNAAFRAIDLENDATIGSGRPPELISR
jgi:hypothetical protein